jgi:4-amino-4-deoxy-L-arabinose transferase-like glycosyltransferase
MSLYYLLLRGWLHFGASETFVRSLSILPALGTIPVLYWLGRRLFDRRVGLIAAALFTCNAYSIRYSQEARSYSLYILLVTAACSALIAFLHTPSKGNRILHVAISVLAVYAHFYAALVIVAQWLSVRLLEAARVPQQTKRNWRWIAGLSAPVLIFAALTGVGPLAWIQRPGFKHLYDYYDHMAGNGGPLLLAASVICCLAALLPLARRLVKKAEPWEIWRFQFLLLWLVFPVLVVAAISFLRPMFVARYFVACLPAFLLLVAAGLSRIPRTWMLVPALVVFLALSMRGTAAYYRSDFDIDRDNWRDATHYVLHHAQPGDVLIFHLAIGRMPYEYYKSLISNQTNVPTVIFPARGLRIEYRDFIGKPSPEFLPSVAGKYRRVWVVLKDNETPSGPDRTTQQLDELFRKHYSEEETAEFAGIEVRLYR